MNFLSKLLLTLGLSFIMLAFASAQEAASSASSATGQVSNIYTKLLPGAEQVKKLKAKFCKCCLGKIISNMMLPLSLATGGCIKPCCPPIPPADMKKSSASAQGACAIIAGDTEESHARRAAVRCLAKVDCNWWPETELALINALRTDKNECVRHEAAMVIGSGCCCTKKMIEALTICINASTKDGNPAENSDRVRQQAINSLQHCLACYKEKSNPVRPEFPGEPPVKPKEVGAVINSEKEFQLAAYYVNLEKCPASTIIANALQTLELYKTKEVPAGITGKRGLFDIFASAQKAPPEQKEVSWNDRLNPKQESNDKKAPAQLPATVINN